MEQELLSEGKCLYCAELFSQKAIAKHLGIHLKKMQEASKKGNTYCHIVVENGWMFLHLLVKGTEEMEDIDIYLRQIWLECCGHMSGFRNKKMEIEMDDTVAKIFTPKTQIEYDYDFGTTTRLSLKCFACYALDESKSIILLSRNEPLKILCTTCKTAPATAFCSVCIYDEDAFLCENCATLHAKTCEDFDDYARMPVVNSPRMGECAYTGGTIDKKRDGVYSIIEKEK